MKLVTVLFTVFFLLVNLAFAGESNQELSSQLDRESYSIGYQVGVSINTDAVEVDMEKLVQGLKDGIAKKDPLINSKEMQDLVLALKEKARDIALKRVQEMRVKNGEESEKFLDENQKKDGVQTTESGLQYRVIKEGEGETPQISDFVKVHYRGTFPDGTEFDSSYSRGEPQTFQTDGVIKGWTEALQMMKVGSRWEVFVPPSLGYGRSGFGLKIPPNKVLVFEMELVGIEQDLAAGNS